MSIPKRALGMTGAHRPHSGTDGLGKEVFDEKREFKEVLFQ